MIQRMQSIWLLLATIALILMLFLPIFSSQNKAVETTVNTMGLYQDAVGKSGLGDRKEIFTPLLVTNIVVAVICFVNIFNFKKRSLQKRIAIVSILLICAFSFWYSIFAEKITGGLTVANFDIGAYLPLLSIIFCLLAIRGVNNDEKLIRSADRLR